MTMLRDVAREVTSAFQKTVLATALDLRFDLGDVDGRITFSRASTKTRYNPLGVMETVASGVASIDYNPASLATSATSLSVGLGTKALTLSTGAQFAGGTPVRISRTSDPANTWMSGIAMPMADGSLRVIVLRYAGAGTFSDWTIIECYGLSVEESRSNLLLMSSLPGYRAKFSIASPTGAFQIGEIVTGGTSGTSGYLLGIDGSTYYVATSGGFSGGEQITGQTSGARGSIGSLTQNGFLNSYADTLIKDTGKVGPDGVAKFWRMEDKSSVSIQRYINDGAIAATTGIYCLSYVVAPGEYSSGRIAIIDHSAPTNFVYLDFSTQTGVATFGANGGGTGAAGGIIPIGNGLYRIWLAGQPNTSFSSLRAVFYLKQANAYVGSVGSGMWIGFRQLTAGFGPTSYIPTLSAQVTRAADIPSMDGSNFSSWYRSDEGTVVVSGTMLDASRVAARALCAVSDGTTSNLQSIIAAAATSGLASASCTTGGVSQFSQAAGTAYAAGARRKVAYAYRGNDFGVSADGGAAVGGSSGSVPTVNQLFLGGVASGNSMLNAYLRRLRFFSQRLNNNILPLLSA